jgi:tripartite-type tricarboxylate transporter receptor subunit TctC
MRVLLHGITVLASALLAPSHVAFAQAFPGKAIRLVVPLSAGSSTEAQARIISPLLTERWKQQIVIDPRPGAATVIGTDIVAKSPPDGHTLLLNSTQFTHVVALTAKLPYDPFTDLVPVTVITTSPQAIVSHPSLPAKNTKELIAFARGHPLSMGTTGNELTARYFNMLAKLNIEPVPYKGGAPLVIDVMGGHVELGIGGLITFQPQIRSGRVRLLGIASATPSLIFPDAPLITKDLPGFDVLSWWGIFAPGNTPRDVITRIRDDIAAVLQVPSVRERLLELGGEPGGESADEFNARVRAEIARWQKVVKEARIKPQ